MTEVQNPNPTTSTGIEELDQLIQLTESIKVDAVAGYAGNKKAARRARISLMTMKRHVTVFRAKIQEKITKPKVDKPKE